MPKDQFDNPTRIYRAAISLFSQKGFGHTSVRDIAAEAHVGEATVFRHFESKEMLLRSIFRNGWAEINQACRQLVDPSEDPLASLVKVGFCAVQHLYKKEPQIGRIFILESRTANRDLETLMITPELDEFHQVLEELIERGQTEGIISSSFHPQALRQALIGVGEDLLLGWLWKDTSTTDFRADYTEDDALHILRGFIEALRVTTDESSVPNAAVVLDLHDRNHFSGSKGSKVSMGGIRGEYMRPMQKSNKILIGKYSGEGVKIEGEIYFVVKEEDVFSITNVEGGEVAPNDGK